MLRHSAAHPYLNCLDRCAWQGCELEELQAEYNRKVLLRITSQVLGVEPGSLKYSDDIRQYMDLDKAAQISGLTQGAVTVVSYNKTVTH